MAWKILEPQTPFIDNWHIKYLCDLLQGEVERIARREHKGKDLIINIPPRSMKSGIVTIYLNAWAWLKYPHLKFITSSYSQDLSTEHAIKTRRLIESQWYQILVSTDSKVFKMSADQNVKSKFENNKSGYRYATSVGGALTGSGADIFITDDPHKASESKSDASRNSVIDWWRNTVFSRLNDQEVGLRIIVMQRLHEADLTGEMLKTGEYKHINIPAMLTEETTSELVDNYVDGLFFPQRFSREVLEKAKHNMGSREYAGQYLQQPSPDDGDIIKRDWFKWFGAGDIPEGLTVNYYTDSAYGKEESDNSATIVYTKHDNNLYVLGCYAWNLPFPDFIKRYTEMVSMTGYSYSSRCYFEPKASGISIVQQLKKSGNITIKEGDKDKQLRFNVIEDKPPVESKVSRVTSSSASIEAGRVYLLKGGVGMEQLIRESIMFPNAKNDDCIDTLSSIIRIELMSRRDASVVDRGSFGF